MRQIARATREGSRGEEGERGEGRWRTEYRKRKAEERNSWRAGWKREKVETDKTEDEATQEEGGRERWGGAKGQGRHDYQDGSKLFTRL